MPHLAFQHPNRASSPTPEHHDLPPQLTPVLGAHRRPEGFATAGEVPRIKVNEVVSTFASAYEKFRNAIEYHEDHLLRKNATERILKRRLLFKVTGDPQKMAGLLIAELIRGSYLPNDAVPESKIGDVAAMIDKYLKLLEAARAQIRGDDARGLTQWIVSLLATDIEENLVPSTRAEAMVRFAYDAVKKDLLWRNAGLDERERDLQLYLAVHRALVRSDLAIIRARLFHLYVPGWKQADSAFIAQTVVALPKLRRTIDYQALHPFGDTILRQVKRTSTAFLILRDVIEAGPNPEERLANTTTLEQSVKECAEARYKVVRSRIARAVLRAVIYIFLTKSLLAFTIEFPYELLISRKINLLPLAINIAFHPLFLFLIAISVHIPSKKNTAKLTTIIEGIIYKYQDRNLPLEVRRPRPSVLNIVFRTLYAATYVLTFGLLVWGLRRIGFNGLSTVIFLFFLSIISFFGIRIRQQTRELIVLPERENIITSLIDLFTVPILQVGRWISLKAPKVNVLIFVLDFIIEAPFKSLMEIVEQWFSFLREKKEEVY